jgi:putative membrane protein
MDYLDGFPAFAAYFGMGIGFVALFLLVFLYLTPHRELALIRAGNHAAAMSLAGALVGFCLPLAQAIAHSVSLLDLGIWGAVALAGQFVAHLLIRLLLPAFPARIERGDTAAGLLSAALHVGIGLLNAAAMSG